MTNGWNNSPECVSRETLKSPTRAERQARWGGNDGSSNRSDGRRDGAMGRWGDVALSPHVDVRNLYCGGKD